MPPEVGNSQDSPRACALAGRIGAPRSSHSEGPEQHQEFTQIVLTLGGFCFTRDTEDTLPAPRLNWEGPEVAQTPRLTPDCPWSGC